MRILRYTQPHGTAVSGGTRLTQRFYVLIQPVFGLLQAEGDGQLDLEVGDFRGHIRRHRRELDDAAEYVPARWMYRARSYLLLRPVDDKHRRVAYTALNRAKHHQASMQIFADGPGRCRFEWITDILPDEVSERFATVMDQAIPIIHRTLMAESTKT